MNWARFICSIRRRIYNVQAATHTCGIHIINPLNILDVPTPSHNPPHPPFSKKCTPSNLFSSSRTHPHASGRPPHARADSPLPHPELATPPCPRAPARVPCAHARPDGRATVSTPRTHVPAPHARSSPLCLRARRGRVWPCDRARCRARRRGDADVYGVSARPSRRSRR